MINLFLSYTHHRSLSLIWNLFRHSGDVLTDSQRIQYDKLLAIREVTSG